MEPTRVFVQTVIDDAPPCHDEAKALLALQRAKPFRLDITETLLDLSTESQPFQL